MGKQGGCTARNLSTEVELRFGLVLLLGCLIAGILTTSLETTAINETVDLMGVATKTSEIQSINVRLTKLAATASSLFTQAKNDVTYQADNAKLVLEGRRTGYAPANAYPSESYVVPPGGNPPANSVANGAPDTTYNLQYYDNFYTGGWWNRNNGEAPTGQVPSNEAFLPAANYLDNAFIPLFMGNDNYAEIYMGFETGMMKKFPWYSTFGYDTSCTENGQDYTSGYHCMEYDCVISVDIFGNANGYQQAVGYTPTCRGWYQKAKKFKDDVVFSNPYKGASKGRAMITVAKAVIFDTPSTPGNEIEGAIGIDIYIQTLADSVLNAKILNSGYTYMIDKQLGLIMHKNIPDMDQMYSVSDIEKPDAAFMTALTSGVAAGTNGKQDFVKEDGSSWYGAWENIQGTDYTMVMVVPYDDINASAIIIEEDGNVALNHLVGWVIGIGIASLALGVICARIVSVKISGPVNHFNKVIQDINDKNFDDADDAIEEESEFSQINHLQSKILSLYLAVKFSTNAYYKNKFEDALKYLTEVEKMFADMKQLHALGVVFNNKGEIMRAGVKEITGDDTPRRVAQLYDNALKSFRLAVANARFLLRTAEEELNRDDGDQESMRLAALDRIAYAKRLGDRLSNMAICCKSAKRYEESLEFLRESADVLSSADDMNGLVRVMGNRGLVFMDLENYAEADKIFQEAYTVSYNAFQSDPNEETVQAFQLSCVNVGQHLKTLVDENIIPADKRQAALSDALKHFYYAITVSNRVNKHLLTRSVRNVADIYKKYNNNESGEIALEKLQEMFPTILSHTQKPPISILVDVSPSMNHNKRIQSATTTLANIIETKIKNGDMLSLDCFASDHDIIMPLTKINSNNRQVFMDAVYALNFKCTKGITHFYKALLELGHNIAKANKKKPALVFALTDGEDNEYRTTQKEVKNFYKNNNIQLLIITIGVGSGTKLKILELVEKPEFVIAAASDDQSSIDEAMKVGFDMVQAQGSVVMESL
jgi:tetratricopeptide (TPR) repeat protein